MHRRDALAAGREEISQAESTPGVKSPNETPSVVVVLKAFFVFFWHVLFVFCFLLLFFLVVFVGVCFSPIMVLISLRFQKPSFN